MSRPARFNGKVYKPAKFGEGVKPSTVEWELDSRRERAADRAVERKRKKREPAPERDLEVSRWDNFHIGFY